jgi:hypothetical protein
MQACRKDTVQRHLEQLSREQARLQAEAPAVPTYPRALFDATKVTAYALAWRTARLYDCLAKGVPPPDGLEPAVESGREWCERYYMAFRHRFPAIDSLYSPKGFPGWDGPRPCAVYAVLTMSRRVLLEAKRRRGEQIEIRWSDVPYESLRAITSAEASTAVTQEFAALEDCLKEEINSSSVRSNPARAEEAAAGTSVSGAVGNLSCNESAPQKGDNSTDVGTPTMLTPGEPVASATTDGVLPPELLETPLSAGQLAALLDPPQPVDRVETFLRRHRKDHEDCFIPLDPDYRKRTEARYLYRPAVVWPILQEKMKAWRQLENE